MNLWCFNGWAQPSDGFRALWPQAVHVPYADHAPDAWKNALPAGAPEIMLGWSLGGQMAVRAVLEAGRRPKALILLATPWRFVGAPDWPQGMARPTYDLFRRNYATDPARTARRFAHLIAQGDAQAARIEAEQQTHLETMRDQARWLPWLDALAAWSPPAGLALPPTLIVHGAADGIVKPAQAEQWGRALPGAELHLWPDCGHAPHLHDAPGLQRLIEDWSQRHAS